MATIAIVGAECSGKTTLSNALALQYNAVLVPEYARDFLQEKKSYSQTDLDSIANAQSNAIFFAQQQKPACIVCDTELNTVALWSEIKFQSCSLNILNLALRQKIDFYLLCYPLPLWEQDALREAPAFNDRLRIYYHYLSVLQNEGSPFCVLNGEPPDRLNAAIAAINGIEKN